MPSDTNPENTVPKPYQFVTFPQQSPPKKTAAGHQKYVSDRLHGTLFLTLKVKTAVHVSTGVVVLGSDINSRLPLIKTMVQGVNKQLLIQGSSLKGCIRAVYETITNSRLGVINKKYENQIPSDRQPCDNKDQLCPASQVFGASGKNWGWQGLLEFSDAKCERTDFATGYMPSLYSPRPDQSRAYIKNGRAVGRKFYYHTIKAIDKGQHQGIPVQQAAKEYTFTTELQFKNLQPAELGTLLIILGQDKNYPIALKIGGGKPVGMGTMTVDVNKIIAFTNDPKVAEKFNLGMLRDRYSNYNPIESAELTGNAIQQFMQKVIQEAHSQLIQAPQLQQLTEILKYPTDRQPPTGMY